ncbi:hypothetical protein T08_7823 [Trichinella sp. T8]|nr:hypothetical protein T08_7823 [Trichinella sp. T8]
MLTENDIASDERSGLCYKNNLKTYSFTDSQYNIDESVISTRPHKFMVLKLSLKVSFVSKPKYSKLQTEDRKHNISTLYRHVRNISDQIFTLYANY